MRKTKTMFYSNCLFEALKAKMLNFHEVKITMVLRSEAGCPHFLWSDGKSDFDFGTDKQLKWREIFWFKGCVRKREVGFNGRYKKIMKERWQRK